MKTPMTSCPSARSSCAATLESTPPDIARTIRAIVDRYGERLRGIPDLDKRSPTSIQYKGNCVRRCPWKEPEGGLRLSQLAVRLGFMACEGSSGQVLR